MKQLELLGTRAVLMLNCQRFVTGSSLAAALLFIVFQPCFNVQPEKHLVAKVSTLDC